MLLEGAEAIGVCNIAVMKKEGELVSPYNEEKDLELYTVPSLEIKELTPGDFLILTPDEGHAPGLAAKEPMAIKKIVFKIPVK